MDGDRAGRRAVSSQATECFGGRTVVYELPTESGSWPYHYHTANEEAIYVISGAGTIVAVRGNSWPPIDGR